MVSGLVTSPCDQLRIFSGDARLIRMESKSVMVLPRSNGLERYKVSSCGCYATADGFRFYDLFCLSQLRIGSASELRFRGFKPIYFCGTILPGLKAVLLGLNTGASTLVCFH